MYPKVAIIGVYIPTPIFRSENQYTYSDVLSLML